MHRNLLYTTTAHVLKMVSTQRMQGYGTTALVSYGYELQNAGIFWRQLRF